MNKQASNWLIVVAVLITAAAIAALARANEPDMATVETVENTYLSAETAWIRPTLGANRNTAAYVTLTNSGATADRLIGGSVPGARAVEVHTSGMEGGVMRMRRLESIDIPAATSVTLAPGGLHIMIFDLEAPLETGSTVPLTLSFEKSGDITLDAQVRLTPPTGTHEAGMSEEMPAAPGSDAGMMDHSGH
ncbi:MAG: copper chaperone PCu(A)C [Parvibaculum sp.]